MLSFRRFFPVFLAAALTLTGCSEHTRLSLSEGWEYARGTAESPSMSFSSLPSETTADLTPLIPGGTGYIWLRKDFTLPPALENEEIGLYLGRISMADVTMINGSIIGEEGRGGDNEFSAWNTARFYRIPSTLLSKGPNTLMLRIWINGEGSISTGSFIGAYKDASLRASIESFFGSRIHLISAFLMLAAAVYHLMLFLRRREDRENLMFALIAVNSAVCLSVFYIWEIPGLPAKWMSWLWFQKIVSAALPFAMPFLVTSFINTFLKRTEKKPVLAARLAFMVIPAAAVLAVPDYASLLAVKPVARTLLIPPVIYIIYILIDALRKKQKEPVPLLAGFSLTVPALILDLILHNAPGLHDMPFIFPAGWFLAVLCLLFTLAGRFAAACTRAEDLNRSLEEKVEERARELSESNGNLEKADELLGKANEQLETAEAELKSVGMQADRDMALAANVQRSFFPKASPNTAEWDVSFIFQPVSDVSRDLYDFFTRGDSLGGIGLFSVSGHGTAAGLMTMLAKTVIDRHFNEGYSEPLAKVLRKIDGTLANEKGGSEDYMKGVLLRISGDTIEMINSGNPKVFCRSGKSGRVFAAELPESGGQANGFIGAGLEPDFKAIRFRFSAGDALILYTDCLSGSRNKDGEEFGAERVSEAFSASGNGNAADKLERVLSVFRSFTDGVPLEDDLTVIVLQHK